MPIITVRKEIEVDVDVEIDTEDYAELRSVIPGRTLVVQALKKEMDYYEINLKDDKAVEVFKRAIEIVESFEPLTDTLKNRQRRWKISL